MHIKKSTIYEWLTIIFFMTLTFLFIMEGDEVENLLDNVWWFKFVIAGLAYSFLLSFKNWMIELFKELLNKNPEV